MCSQAKVHAAKTTPRARQQTGKGLGLGLGRDSPFQVAVHYGEEHLEEEVDGIYQDRQQVQPRFARHVESLMCCVALSVFLMELEGRLAARPREGSTRTVKDSSVRCLGAASVGRVVEVVRLGTKATSLGVAGRGWRRI